MYTMDILYMDCVLKLIEIDKVEQTLSWRVILSFSTDLFYIIIGEWHAYKLESVIAIPPTYLWT